MPAKEKPIYLVYTKDKTSKKLFNINIISSPTVEPPPVDLTDDQLTVECIKESALYHSYKIPFLSSPIFWTDGEKSEYIIHVKINDKFVKDRVLNGNTVRHVLVGILVVELEKKFNSGIDGSGSEQVLGHKLDLDVQNYGIKDGIVPSQRMSLIVNERNLAGDSRDQDEEKLYDLYYRPGLQVLTCSVQTTEMPTSFGFNKDRLIVKVKENTLVDVHLPFFIDLKEPIKYKYDEKTNNFRVVIKINEEDF